MIGDRMDTDIVAGLMSGLDTILVMTGVSQIENMKEFPYRPSKIVNSINDIEFEK
jgi:NagD protein